MSYLEIIRRLDALEKRMADLEKRTDKLETKKIRNKTLKK